MTRKPVQSSTIAEIGYDHDTLVLEIKFLKGGIYRYADVDFGTFNSLMSAKSQGKFFLEFVKGKFAATRVE